jgi:nucleotide-binding universal stress UspA family protein
MALAVKETAPRFRYRRAPPVRVAYHRVLVPVARDADMEAMTIACRLAADRDAVVEAVHVVEMPLELPLDAHMLEEDAEAKRLLRDAAAIGDLHGVRVEQRIVRGRAAGEAIVAMASTDAVQIIVLDATVHAGVRRRVRALGSTVEFILTHAPCRVLVAASDGRS